MGLASTPSDPFISFQLPQDSHRLPCPRLHADSTHALSSEVLTVFLSAELQRLISNRPLALSPEQAPAQAFLPDSQSPKQLQVEIPDSVVKRATRAAERYDASLQLMCQLSNEDN